MESYSQNDRNQLNAKKPNKEPLIKLWCVFVLGICVPNISGLITNSIYSVGELAGSYAYFIGTIFTIWQSNVIFMTRLPPKLNWPRTFYYKIISILFFSNIVYSGFVSAGLFMLWKSFSREEFTGWEPVFKASLFIIIISTFVTNVYEIVFLNNERRNSLSRVEQLSIEKMHAELEVLKFQTDPHFLFNSLNTLSFLVNTGKPGAKYFIHSLAEVYRYILRNKKEDFVLLKEEIEFTSNYFYLLKIRFGKAINMVNEINDEVAEGFLILPISLQVLVENAIKHNEFNERMPLEINISVAANQVIIKNVIHKKQIFPGSTQTGLKNLNNRYQYLTKKNIVIETANNVFVAKLPILKF